ncbi:sensor histidine kinase [Amycolatopsis echigonensis]|uniref:histidine kinase n=1 Tax=Amycolatopsis echigonensis TaxID=2576905 RepID=A0A8E1VXD3_9PSEU|nr:histidine kinase [Amycolatopsis echigonensis]MBB2500008.1 sensor histidine kinase [Amycolatopsis echigonensis]
MIVAQAKLKPWQQGWRLAAAALIGGFAWLAVASQLPPGADDPRTEWLVFGYPIVGLGCLVASLWRRKYPLSLATGVVIVSAVSTSAGGAALLVLGSLATRRRPVETTFIGLACVATGAITESIYPRGADPDPWWLSVSFIVLITGIVVAVGAAIGARREELQSLRQRAESAEREQVARAAEARIVERHRIAREMHDVLAHRVSLIAMQAGVLGHRTDLPAEQVSLLARGIADGAHQALEELREVLGVLRASPGGLEPPQPSLANLPALVADARALGVNVVYRPESVGTPPDLLARTVYRIVQEGLTNAGKHAPGAEVCVTVEGGEGEGLRVTVRDSGAATGETPPPSAGFGLLGLSERVELAGGELDHRADPDGGFVLTAWLPWPARAEGSE